MIISILSFVLCCICRRRSRDKAKKRHFARLVNDLNAEEKFTLVTPSDEESDWKSYVNCAPNINAFFKKIEKSVAKNP